MRRDQLEMLAREALALPRDRERGDALGALVRGAREDGVDVRLRRVRDPELGACETEAVAVLFRPELQRGRVEPASGSLSANAATASPAESLGIQSSRSSGFGPQNRVSAEALKRERRLRLGAAVRESLAQLAELPGRPGEDELEEPFVGQRLYERPVQPAGLALLRDCREALVAEPARLLEEVSHPAAPPRPSARPSRRAP